LGKEKIEMEGRGLHENQPRDRLRSKHGDGLKTGKNPKIQPRVWERVPLSVTSNGEEKGSSKGTPSSEKGKTW